MPREIELATSAVLQRMFGPPLPTPEWLVRPGRSECGERWDLVREIYNRLTGLDLPDAMRPVERRTVDGVFKVADNSFVFELDESQHFNEFRMTTLFCYPDGLPIAFDKADWLRRCRMKTRLEGGGFAKPKPPLFPAENGRHQQRAFRDALCDIVPPEHGWLPALRLGDFDVGRWIEGPEADQRMMDLVEARLGPFMTR